TDPGSQAGTQQDQEKALTVTEDLVSPEPSVVTSSSPADVSADVPVQQTHDHSTELPISHETPSSPEMPPLQTAEPARAMPVYGRVDPDLSTEGVERTQVEDSFVPPPWQSPSPATPFYRSRPFWILAVVILLGVTFVIVRNTRSFLNQK